MNSSASALLRPLLVSSLLLALACGDDPVASEVTATITATELSADIPEEGVEICITNFSGYACATTDADGVATMTVPAGADVLFRFSKEGSTYVPSISPVSTPEIDFAFEGEMVDLFLAQILAAGVGAEVDETKGQLFISAGGPDDLPSDESGYTFTIAPAGCDGFFYFNESAAPDPALTETSGAGAAAAVNLEPGDYTFTFAPPDSRRCRFESGWQSGELSGSFPIEAGTVTIVGLEDCE